MKIYFETPVGKSFTYRITKILSEVMESHKETIETSEKNIPNLIPSIEKEVKDRVIRMLNHAYIRIEL
jgi:hypothetical protein